MSDGGEFKSVFRKSLVRWLVPILAVGLFLIGAALLSDGPSSFSNPLGYRTF